jgi:hypothetical protein
MDRWESEAELIVPDWGDKVDYGIGLPYRPVRLHRLAVRGTTILCQSRLYPPIRDYEFGYEIHVSRISCITGSGLPVLTYHWIWYGTVEICTSAVESCFISGKGRRVSLLHTSYGSRKPIT